jgi:nucleoside-diphosphate-sugar epimerase
MKVLLVGGSGHVGSFVTPYLRPHHALRVLDLQPPRHAEVEFVQGSITNPDDLRRALTGVDTFINMVMKSPQGGSSTDQTLTQIVENYEVNTLGLHLLLWTAQALGITRGVHTSTMSVHYRERTWYPSEELVAYDTPSVYGLTKGFGEQICQYFARWFDMNLIALRITGPRTREQFLAERRQKRVDPASVRLYVTDEAVFIAGDECEQEHNLSKARRLLGWQPRSHQLIRAD